MTTERALTWHDRRIRTQQTVRVILWLALLAALLVFALLNTDDTKVDWLVQEDEAPLFVIIAASAGAGFLMGLIATARRRGD
jgi:uncharacterized integral membrane protein